MDYWLAEVVATQPGTADLRTRTRHSAGSTSCPPLGRRTGSTGSPPRCADSGSTDWPRPANAVPRVRTPRRAEKGRRCCAIGRCCGARLSARSVSDVRATPPRRAQPRRRRRTDQPERRHARQCCPDASRKTQAARPGRPTKPARSSSPRGATGTRSTPPTSSSSCSDCARARFWASAGDDLDLRTATLTSAQLQRVGGRLLRRETKTEGSDADLPLPGICATALQLRRQWQRTRPGRRWPAWQGDGLVFTTRYGTPIEPRNFNRSWDTRCTKAGVRKITVHDGRRSCGTLLADLDVHPRVAMQILRHAQFSLTMEIYTDGLVRRPPATR